MGSVAKSLSSENVSRNTHVIYPEIFRYLTHRLCVAMEVYKRSEMGIRRSLTEIKSA